MQMITVTNLFPNRLQVRHGIFVRERLKQFKKSTQINNIEHVVIAPVPWFPFGLRRRLKLLKGVEYQSFDQELNAKVHHPRYLALPIVGNLTSPLTYFWAIRPILKQCRQQGGCVLLDAHFGFPDSVAATLAAKSIGAPVLVTMRGSDINQMARELGINQWIRWLIKSADRVITVSQALHDAVVHLGGSEKTTKVIRNGVDFKKFTILQNREEARRKLEICGRTILSVGNLVPLKGHELIVEALSELQDYNLIIVGSGPEEESIKRRASILGVDDRVRIVPELPQNEIVRYYQSADVLVLASSREGLPNVILEALACGMPVVATNVGGVSEVIQSHTQGVLVKDRSAEAIAQGIRKLNLPIEPGHRSSLRRSVSEFDWEETTLRLDKIVTETIEKCRK